MSYRNEPNRFAFAASVTRGEGSRIQAAAASRVIAIRRSLRVVQSRGEGSDGADPDQTFLRSRSSAPREPCWRVISPRRLAAQQVASVEGAVASPVMLRSGDGSRDDKLTTPAVRRGSMTIGRDRMCRADSALDNRKRLARASSGERGTEESNLALRFWRPPSGQSTRDESHLGTVQGMKVRSCSSSRTS